MKKNNPCGFAGNPRFKKELLEKMRAIHSPELSDEELEGVLGGQNSGGQKPRNGCADWENEAGEPYRGCANCTRPDCRDL